PLDFIEIRVQNLWTGSTSIIGQISNPSSFNSVEWTLPEQAQYFISAIARTSAGDTINSSPVIIYVKEPLSQPPDLSLVPQPSEE
ncbi:hypothetical protein KJ758_02765, partial [Patescibacteria group bacterium]|nr:hypothetical protein [Patescibacteria group bacterium]